MKIAGYEIHPVADLFPMMEGEELQALADDINANGLRESIVLYAEDDENGKHVQRVLDGRNRLRACEIAGVAPRTIVWGKGPVVDDPLTYVVSQNLHRRHLDATQRAMVAAKLTEFYALEAKVRQVAAQNNDAGRAVRADLPEQEKGRAREKAAEVMNVSPRLVADAITVTKEAKPEVVEAVKAGKVAVSAAAKATREERVKNDRNLRNFARRLGRQKTSPFTLLLRKMTPAAMAKELVAELSSADLRRLLWCLLKIRPDLRDALRDQLAEEIEP